VSSKSRGYYGESRIAKKVNGTIAGRSKAVKLSSGKVIKIDHNHPIDVVTDLFGFESKYRLAFPKKISDYMFQAETNAGLCEPKLIPVAVVKDKTRKQYYYIMREQDWIDLHVGSETLEVD